MFKVKEGNGFGCHTLRGTKPYNSYLTEIVILVENLNRMTYAKSRKIRNLHQKLLRLR